MKISSKKLIIAGILLALLVLVPASVLAVTHTVPVGDYILTVPIDYASCNPYDTVSVAGVPSGGSVLFLFGYWTGVEEPPFASQSVAANADGVASWDLPYEGRTGTFYLRFNIYDAAGVLKVSLRVKWIVTCDAPGAGCTPGYWRNHEEDWVGYDWDYDFDATFGVGYFDPDITLGEAIWLGGGGVNKVARHGTAALLSAAHPDVNYPFSVAQVIAYVQAGDVNPLAAANELGCSIP